MVVSKADLKKMIKAGYLSPKGKKKAQEVLDGKHNKSRVKAKLRGK